MKTRMSIIIAALLAAPLFSHALESLFLEDQTQNCYGQAMIGFDSVINSRLGVPAEHALDLSLNRLIINTNDEQYSTNLLKVILDAYLWEGSPHDYSVIVFDRCASAYAPPLGGNKH